MKSIKSKIWVFALLTFVILVTVFTQINTATTQQERTIRNAVTIGKDTEGAYIQPISGSNSIRVNASPDRVGIYIGSNNGLVGVGTLRPQAKLDVAGSVKATAFNTGDIIFRIKDKEVWRMYEKEDGLYLESVVTKEASRVFLEKDIVPLKNELKALRQELEQLKQHR